MKCRTLCACLASFLFFSVAWSQTNVASIEDIEAAQLRSLAGNDIQNFSSAVREISRGRYIFRFDTFGDEDFWGGALRLHEAIAGAANGGVGPGLSPKAALEAGLKVDVQALPFSVRDGIRRGTVDLSSPATTLTLLKLNAVVGVRGFFDSNGQRLRSVGITCALCHSTVDNSFAPGIGSRLDG